jgi:hypothetical protein
LSIGFWSGLEKYPQFFEQGPRILSFALPNDKRLPAELVKLLECLLVAAPIGFKFREPVIMARFRRFPLLTIVPMPKATVHEYGLLSARKDDVGFARKSSRVQPVAKPMRMK